MLMNIKIYLDRYTETCCVPGTQFEQNATVIKFDFSELDFIDDECVKTIHFFHDSLEEMNYIGDSIIKNDEFEIPKSITKYENVVAFIQITKKDFIWKTKSFNLDFYDSLDVDKTLDEDEIGILQELILEVKEIQNITTEKFEEVAEKATEDFNKNATEKLNDFNDNYTDKLNSFNENSNSKVNNYNSNAESKTEDFNANADNQKSNFDNNVTEKTNTFNSNTESKITEFNSNATSKETAYNENATSKLNEYNENHTTKLNAYNENSADKIAELNDFAAEKIEEYDNHIEDLDNIVSKNVANGESIYVDDALKYKIFDCKIDGNVNQTTTTGKNYFNAYAIKNPNIIVEDNGQTIKMPLVSSGNGVQNTKSTLAELCPNLTVGDKVTLIFNRNLGNTMNGFIYLGGTVDEVWVIGNSKTITAEMLNCEVMLYGNRYMDGETEQCIITDFTIMKSSETDTTFEPFTNNEPSPNPDYPQEITTIKDSVKLLQVGKNLFNTANKEYSLASLDINISNNELLINGTSTGSTGRFVIADNLNLKTSNYIFSFFANNIIPNLTFEFYDLEDNLCKFESANNKTNGSIVIQNHSIKKISAYSNNVQTFSHEIKLQIEEGSVATDYEEYQSNEYTIDLQGNELVKLTDDIKDIIEIDKLGNVSLLKNTTKKIFDGTESWNEFDNQYLMNCVRFRLNYDINDINALCDKLQLKLANEYWTNDVECLGYSDTGHYIAGQIKKSRLDENASLQSFKDFLAENNLTVYHKTTELTTTSLGQLANFKTYAGINHFFLEANLSTNFEIKYVQDLQKVISKQQAEIDELKTLLSSKATSAMLLDNYANDLMEEV